MTGDYEVREWWLVRHAPVKTKGLIYGHLDLDADFSDTGRLDTLADILPKEACSISSDLTRCRDTAQRIFDLQGGTSSPLIERETLREQHFGHWEGKPYQEVEAEDEARYRSFFNDPVGYRPDGGESFQELAERVEREIHTLAESVAAQDLILFTHAGVIRAIVGLALDIRLQNILSLAVDPLSLTHLTSFRKGGETSWRVNFLNDLNRD